MALFADVTLTLTGTDEPERLPGEFVGHGYFEMLGIEPHSAASSVPRRTRSRSGTPSSSSATVSGNAASAATAASSAGRIELDGRVYTIVGVTTPRFRGVEDSADLWLPVMMAVQQQDLANSRQPRPRGPRPPETRRRHRPGAVRK